MALSFLINNGDCMQDDLSKISIFVGEKKAIQIGDVVYYVSASPMGELPQLIGKIQEFEKFEIDTKSSDISLKPEMMELMCEIMEYGIKKYQPEITHETMKKNWPLAAFPIIVRIMLDLNDFLAGMRELQTPMRIISGLVEDTQEKSVTRK